MRIEELNILVRLREHLTNEEKTIVANAIMENDEARAKAIKGFIKQREYSKAFQISLANCA